MHIHTSVSVYAFVPPLHTHRDFGCGYVSGFWGYILPSLCTNRQTFLRSEFVWLNQQQKCIRNVIRLVESVCFTFSTVNDVRMYQKNKLNIHKGCACKIVISRVSAGVFTAILIEHFTPDMSERCETLCFKSFNATKFAEFPHHLSTGTNFTNYRYSMNNT